MYKSLGSHVCLLPSRKLGRTGSLTWCSYGDCFPRQTMKASWGTFSKSSRLARDGDSSPFSSHFTLHACTHTHARTHRTTKTSLHSTLSPPMVLRWTQSPCSTAKWNASMSTRGSFSMPSTWSHCTTVSVCCSGAVLISDIKNQQINNFTAWMKLLYPFYGLVGLQKYMQNQ